MTIPSDAPDLAALKGWLGLATDDTEDDALLEESLDAALEQQNLVVTYPENEFAELTFPDDLREAVFLRAQRLVARRNSPEGVVGLSGLGGDFVSARVPAYDADVVALESPHRTIAVS